jgi:hypothetical protein
MVLIVGARRRYVYLGDPFPSESIITAYISLASFAPWLNFAQQFDSAAFVSSQLDCVYLSQSIRFRRGIWPLLLPNLSGKLISVLA